MFDAEGEKNHHQRDSKLQAVLIKLQGVVPRAEDLGNASQKMMSSDIIESVLADTPIPAQSKSTRWMLLWPSRFQKYLQ